MDNFNTIEFDIEIEFPVILRLAFSQVIEFLMDVEELSGNGTYSPDSVEVALVFNPEKEKVMFSLVFFFHVK